MRTWTEYLLLLAAGTGGALLICFLFGAKRRVLTLVLLNSVAGAAVAFIPMCFGIYLPAWAVAVCGAAGAAGVFLYFI